MIKPTAQEIKHLVELFNRIGLASADFNTAVSAADDFTSAINAVAERTGMKPKNLRLDVKRHAGDSKAESAMREDLEQLALLLED